GRGDGNADQPPPQDRVERRVPAEHEPRVEKQDEPQRHRGHRGRTQRRKQLFSVFFLCVLCASVVRLPRNMGSMTIDSDNAYSELIRRVREASLLGSCAGVLGWDERTYLPKRGGALRGDQMGLLARLCHEMLTDPAIGDLLGKVEGSSLVADAE